MWNMHKFYLQKKNILFGSKYFCTTGILIRKRYIEEIHVLCCSSKILWVIKDNEMDGACGTYGREEKCILDFSEDA